MCIPKLRPDDPLLQPRPKRRTELPPEVPQKTEPERPPKQPLFPKRQPYIRKKTVPPEVPQKPEPERPPKGPTEVPPKPRTELPPKPRTELPPKGRTERPQKTERPFKLPPKGPTEVPPKPRTERPFKLPPKRRTELPLEVPQKPELPREGPQKPALPLKRSPKRPLKLPPKPPFLRPPKGTFFLKKRRPQKRKRLRKGRLRLPPIQPGHRIHFKNTNLLIRFISEKGKILSRKVTKLTFKQQRLIAIAIKQARILSLLPFVSNYKIFERIKPTILRSARFRNKKKKFDPKRKKRSFFRKKTFIKK